MAGFTSRFERVEQKYLLDESKYNTLFEAISGHITPDEFGESQVCNIYYDTPDWRIVRRSIRKPLYKEKLRLRTYGIPNSDSYAFVEIKKKINGVVYKRRAYLRYANALDYLAGKCEPEKKNQVTGEVDWFLHSYEGIRPAMIVAYKRTAFFGIDDPDLRITFDRDITWRTEKLDISKGVSGNGLLPHDKILMEIKMKGSMPLWLARCLSDNEIYTIPFSKYGMAYSKMKSLEN